MRMSGCSLLVGIEGAPQRITGEVTFFSKMVSFYVTNRCLALFILQHTLESFTCVLRLRFPTQP